MLKMPVPRPGYLAICSVIKQTKSTQYEAFIYNRSTRTQLARYYDTRKMQYTIQQAAHGM